MHFSRDGGSRRRVRGGGPRGTCVCICSQSSAVVCPVPSGPCGLGLRTPLVGTYLGFLCALALRAAHDVAPYVKVHA